MRLLGDIQDPYPDPRAQAGILLQDHRSAPVSYSARQIPSLGLPGESYTKPIRGKPSATLLDGCCIEEDILYLFLLFYVQRGRAQELKRGS